MNITEYNKCVDHYSDHIYRFVLKNMRDTERAKDVVQETFEKLWNKVSEVGADKAKSYLFTTAYRTMIDHLRRDKFRAEYDEDKHDDFFTVENNYNDLKKILNEALGKLNEVQRSVILLRDYEGYSYEEIGEITGLNESQVKVYIYRARLFLKEYIGSLDSVL